MKRHMLRTGEYLAIAEDAIRHDADGFFFLMGGESPENEERGAITIVNVRGALSQFRGDGGDSYEALVERIGEAFASEPEKVVLRISSPGGVVAGLNETVFKLQRMSKAAKIPLIACIDELAASAAYAICCACSEILAPKTAVVGSVGVISTMVSVAKADAKAGIEFRIITSGKRKADGHLHAPISKEAVSAEEARNEELAQLFFELAGKARGLSPKKLQSLEAGISLGREAARIGLIDDVMSFDDVLGALGASEVSLSAEHAPNDGNATERRAKEIAELDNNSKAARMGPDVPTGSIETLSENTHPEADPMSVKLDALIRTTEASIASETDSKKLAALRVKLGAFLATKAEMDDDEPPKKKDDDDDEPDDDSASAKHAKRAAKLKAKAKATELRGKAAELKGKAAQHEEEAKKCEEEAEGEEEDDEAHLRVRPVVASVPGLSDAAAEILASQAATGTEALKRVAALEARAVERDRQATIAKLVNERRVTPGEAEKWKKKDSDFWAQVEEMRPRALVSTIEDALFEPDQKTSAGDIPADVKALVESDLKMQGLEGDRAKEYREKSYAAHRAAKSGGLNGAGAY
jgi:ClpP class serine protease